ncbi:hypothetical protein C8A03DRAFT_45785 [Achaetomium macrosporum]|uniref:BTB domain-containing protein n=1 Tax=Achaetomium macrosporum TaxID=79813 RepID=A0AAN7C6Z4_9PEZI|nr:hypothetical protein C8A03DRAFT_45785 [Achaetomium macrosporum]
MEGIHEVDPCGDVIITLRNPGAPFAKPAVEESPVIPTDALPSRKTLPRKAPPKKPPPKKPPPSQQMYGSAAIEEAPAEELPALVAEGTVTEVESVVEAEVAVDLDGLLGDGSRKQEKDRRFSEPPEMRMRVSSRHLILASPYFRAALNGRWQEAVSVSADSFLILMQIIHGRNRQVPRLVSLELLAKIAVLVDYYECYEVVEVFVALWFQGLKSQNQLPAHVNGELVLWLFISWVFGDADLFTSVTSTALRQSQGPLPTFGLPIPKRIVG